MIDSMQNVIINFVWIAIKETTRGDCAKIATRNKAMKLRQKSVWIAK